MTDKSEGKTTDKSSVVPLKIETASDAGKGPIRVMMEVAENEKLSDQDRATLISYAQTRFTNRRRMAYVALCALIFSLAFLFVAAFVDGFTECVKCKTCTGILDSIKKVEAVIIWIEGFLATIVAAYYGVSAWRPGS
uniref:Uncharacterized protein n=1 Tax=Candidatus Kentrum sp. TC TaxID=2126339 RepID=A0A450ZPH0_9GAMM|nr:MAG: hypothetical protein BECKTC1821F_GA0114240_100765 [Candidatus Kentron sp. TC]